MNMTREDFLLGIRHWVQWYPIGYVPRYKIFRYIGKNSDLGFYYFQDIKTNMLLGRSFYQLNNFGFQPFCLDYKKIAHYTQTIGT